MHIAQLISILRKVSLSFLSISFLIMPVSLWAEQFLLIDTTFKHGLLDENERPYSGWQSHLNLQFTDEVPDNWSSPVNYGGGKSYWRIAMMEKQPDKAIKWQMCLNNDDPQGTGNNTRWHMCCNMIDIDDPGVYWGEQNLPWWNWPAPPVWNEWGGYPQAVVKDAAGEPVTNPTVFPRNWDGFPDYSQYYPMTLRITMYIVSAGGTFEAPEWWDEQDVNAGLPVYGCTDQTYEEYDPQATMDDGSCETLIVEGCMDPDYEEYDSTANLDDGTCRTLHVNRGALYTFPFTFTRVGNNQIRILFLLQGNASIEIITPSGEIIEKGKITGKREITFNTINFGPGVYIFRLVAGSEVFEKTFAIIP
jgi:hypothetical protein